MKCNVGGQKWGGRGSEVWGLWLVSWRACSFIPLKLSAPTSEPLSSPLPSHPDGGSLPWWACSLTQACSPPTAGKGLVEAAHFCYLMAHVPFGYYTVKTDYLALLGSSHRYASLLGDREWGGRLPGDWVSPSWVSWLPFSMVSCEFSAAADGFSAQVGSGLRDARKSAASHCQGSSGPDLAPGSYELGPVGCIVPLWPLGGALAP